MASTKLVGSTCPTCGRLSFPARQLCSECWVETDSTALDGRGEIETATVVHRAAPGTPTPYVVAYVALHAGIRVFAPVRELHPDEVKPGLPVNLVVADHGVPYSAVPARVS